MRPTLSDGRLKAVVKELWIYSTIKVVADCQFYISRTALFAMFSMRRFGTIGRRFPVPTVTVVWYLYFSL